MIASQVKDPKLVVGDAGCNSNKEHHSEFYNQPCLMAFLNTLASTSVVAPTTKNMVSQDEPTANDDGGIGHDLQARMLMKQQ
ncbi:hypothetical protein KIW84_077042 [Lathyrus oleraceus]|uniref:Uncharacterized protein n=1 Tax=Pisum sativum TaxID=3888 RepID=A0A9D4VZD4_PEA|nr:hypothetical protein KIW84_077042 [Pisum sativum]